MCQNMQILIYAKRRTWKNPLTKGKNHDIINKLSERESSMECKEFTVNASGEGKLMKEMKKST